MQPCRKLAGQSAQVLGEKRPGLREPQSHLQTTRREAQRWESAVSSHSGFSLTLLAAQACPSVVDVPSVLPQSFSKARSRVRVLAPSLVCGGPQPWDHCMSKPFAKGTGPWRMQRPCPSPSEACLWVQGGQSYVLGPTRLPLDLVSQ